MMQGQKTIKFKSLIPVSQMTHCTFITKISCLMPFREVIRVALTIMRNTKVHNMGKL
jgi:hypothetical protein